MNTLIVVSTLFPVVLVGCLLPLLGRSRRGLLFGVTVSLEFAAGAEVRAAVRRYRVRTVVWALLGVAAVAVSLALGGGEATPVVSLVAILVELVAAMVIWQRERRAMKPHAVTVPLERSAELMPQRHLGGIYASVAALLPLALEAVWLQAHWAMIPASWPRHWDAYGHANGWGTRTGNGVFFPLEMGAGIVLMMTVTAAFIAFAPGPQSKQRRLALAPLAGLSWVMAATFCWIGSLPLRPSLSVGAIVTAVALQLVAALGVVVWLVWRSGIMNTGAGAAPYDSTPDAMWRAGILYYNPGDAAVIVPKRYGFGWTLNFARPVAWVYLGGVLLVVVIAAVGPLLLRK